MILRTNKYFFNTIHWTASVMEKYCAFWEWKHDVLYETLVYMKYRFQMGKKLFKIPFTHRAIIAVEKLYLIFIILHTLYLHSQFSFKLYFINSPTLIVAAGIFNL